MPIRRLFCKRERPAQFVTRRNGYRAYTVSMTDDALHATTRFGLGPRLNEPLPGDARGWLLGQLDGADPTLATPGPSTADGLTAWHLDRKTPVPEGTPPRVHELWQAERAAIGTAMVTARAPFRERLVWFWANHFTISSRQGEINAVAGAYIREAIRPNVTARFADLLIAVMTHPAMLLYLDNGGSIGPDSRAALATRPGQPRRGLNENLARECLELHTVSPAAGYTQADVTAAAGVLTGWAIEIDGAAPGFVFRPDAHQPGEIRVLGQTFPAGMQGGLAMLTWLGTHPATYAHIAKKLVTHFAGDLPPADAVARVNRVLTATRGDLRAASAELVAIPTCWTGEKMRPPQEYLVAAARAVDLPADQHLALVNAMGAIGQPLLGAPLPNGFSDRAEDWNSGEALLRRVDWAWSLAGRLPDVEPGAVFDTVLGPAGHPELRRVVKGAGSRREGLALLLSSPPMMRR